MDIPLQAEVQCKDKVCGKTTCVIIDPRTEKVTHVVVKENQPPQAERMVPVEAILDTTPNSIILKEEAEDLSYLEEFVDLRFVRSEIETYAYEPDEFVLWPYRIPQEKDILMKKKRLPPGELDIHRGAEVQAVDGRVGEVGEFLVEPSTGHITHLILKEGHLWGESEVTIPISMIDRFSDGVVYLNLTKKEISSYPNVPLRRWS
jgi:sporulation protein YlmC with PRC-barrel domain